MNMYLVTTHSVTGEESRAKGYEPMLIESESLESAAESLNGEIKVSSTHFILVSKKSETGKKVKEFRYLVSKQDN